MTEQVIIVDTRTLVGLAAWPSSGNTHSLTPSDRLDVLLQGEQRIVILPDVIEEMRNAPQGSDFRDWYASNHQPNNPNSSILTPDFSVDPSTLPVDSNGNIKQRADEAIKQWAQLDNEFESRFLSDEGGIYTNEQTNGRFDLDDLASRGQYAPPYAGTGEFMNELLLNGHIGVDDYGLIADDFQASNTYHPPNVFGHNGQFLTEDVLNNIQPEGLGGSNIGNLILSGGALGSALTVLGHVGFVGDAFAAELR